MFSNKPAKEDEKNQIKLKGICSECKKPQRELRKGSITAWIFSAGSCTCRSTILPTLKTVDGAAPLSESNAAAAMQRALRGEVTNPRYSPATDPREMRYADPPDEVINPKFDPKSSEHYPPFPDLGKRYEVIEQVGAGGMGAVYKIRDKELGKTFAAKLLRYELARDQEAVKRFKQEAEAASRLTHANLGTVYSHGLTTEGAPYLVMDFIEGKNLAELIQTEKLDQERILDILSQVCEGLEHAHNKGVIHRDLKPSNIIVSKSPEGNDLVHLVDFGIAKVLARPGETLTSLTQTGDIFGSPLYMSPEQCSGGTINERSDIYSLGCVMFEMFQGHPPFEGKNPFLVMMQQVNDPAPSATKAGPTMAGIIECCLSKEPEYRYERVNHLYRDLIALANGKAPRFVQIHPRRLAPKLAPPDRSYRAPSQGDDLDVSGKTVFKIAGATILMVSIGVMINYSQPAPQRPAEPEERIENKALNDGINGGIDKYMRTKEFAKAIPLLELVIEKERKERDDLMLPVHLELLGECHYATGDMFAASKSFKESMDIYERTKKQSNSHYEACMNYAKVLRKENKISEAEIFENRARGPLGNVLSPSVLK